MPRLVSYAGLMEVTKYEEVVQKNPQNGFSFVEYIMYLSTIYQRQPLLS
jgi:hypothetical protein